MHMLRLLGALTALAGMLACGSSGMDPYSTGTPPANQQPPSNPSASTPNVTVQDDFFQPAVDTVSANTTVTWTWSNTLMSHNVTFEDGASSGTQQEGTFQRTFTSPGTYAYRCTIHSSSFTQGMTGTIVVK